MKKSIVCGLVSMSLPFAANAATDEDRATYLHDSPTDRLQRNYFPISFTPEAYAMQQAINQSLSRDSSNLLPGITLPSNHWLLKVTTYSEIVFVDPAVDEYEKLVSALPIGTEVIVLNASRPALLQMAEAVAGRQNIDAIHVISHGQAGEISFSWGALNSETVSDYVDHFAAIGNSMTESGDILFYGCNVAADAKGEALINRIATLTGAEVAASNDLTANLKGADWDLEIRSGSIEASTLLTMSNTSDYQYALVTTNVTTVGELRTAITAANGTTSNDIINLAAGTYTLSGATNEDSNVSGDLDINKATGTLTIKSTVGAIISANRIDRVLDVFAGNVTVDGLTIQNGLLYSGVGGNGNVANNTVAGAGGDALGAGIRNAGTLTIQNSTITSNKAAGGGGAGFQYGGGGASGYGTVGGADGGIGYTLTIGPGGTYGGGGGGGGGGYAAGGNGGAGVGGLGGPGYAGFTVKGSGGRGGSGVGIGSPGVGGTGGAGNYGGQSGGAGGSLTGLGGGGGGGCYGVSFFGGGAITGDGGAGGSAVGGIYNTGTLTVLSTTISNNSGAGGGGGGGDDYPGAGAHPAHLTAGGSGGNGVGAIQNDGGTLNYNNTVTFTGNGGAEGAGGGGNPAGTAGAITANVLTTGGGTTVSNYVIPNSTPTGSVTISGTVTQGQQLTANNTLADADGLGTFVYQWKSGGGNVGTDSNLYTLVQADVGNTITCTISYLDGGSTNESVTSTATAAVANVNDNPVITSNGGNATAATSINENTTAVTTVTFNDPDTGDAHTFSLSGGADQTKFNIHSGSGVLTFKLAPDFETPTDAGGNNVYDVQVTVTDDGTSLLTDVQDIAVTVNNVNENPVITSNSGLASAAINAAENQTAVTDVNFADDDTADTHAFTLTGGADQAKFSIVSGSGVLTFLAAPNFEVPTDVGANGVYDVQVTVTDNGTGSLTDVQDIAVTVSDVYETPVITSAAYNWNTGQLLLTGTSFIATAGPTNDIVAAMLTLTGEGGSYTLTDTANVEIASSTAATLTLSTIDKLNIHGLLNRNGTTSASATYNLAGADGWMPQATDNEADLTGNPVTVSSVAIPTITSAIYDSDTGIVIVTGMNLFRKFGAANDVDLSMFTFTGGTGNATYTLLTPSLVEITSATSFTFTLSGSDKIPVDALLNQIGTSSSGGSTYNIAGADNWLTGANAGTNISDAINAVTVSINPTVTSATYNAATGALVVTGTNMQAKTGVTNDITAIALTLTGEGGATYRLTNTANVERDSITQFTMLLSATDKAAVNQIMNKGGTASTGTTTYNLAAADDWNANVTAGDSSDLTLNAVTVSSVSAPSITSSIYNATAGSLVVTGSGFTKFTGATNDIIAIKFTFTGDGGATYTLTNSANAEITSGTTFTIILSATDRVAVNQIIDKNGTSSSTGTIYNINAAEDWAAGADAAVNVVDATGNGITVSNLDVTPPTTTISAIDISADTGSSAADFTTKTAAQTITGTLSTTLAAGEILYGSVDAGATWIDVTAKVTGTAINWDGATLAGASSIKFKVTDLAANDGAIATQAYVLDTATPTITRVGSDPYTLIAGQTYVDADATAADLVDGNITVNIVTVNPVPGPATEGVYTVTYNVSDAAGNAATQVTRTVRVAAASTTNGGSTARLALTGTAAFVDIYSAGQVLFGLSSSAAGGTLPANTTFPFGLIDYYTSASALGASQTVRLTFSSALPANLVIYKEDSAGNYTLLSTTIWTQIDANTVDVILTDGDAATDLDGVANGVIHDPLAVGSASTTTGQLSIFRSGGGGCTLNPKTEADPTMALILLLSAGYLLRRKQRPYSRDEESDIL